MLRCELLFRACQTLLMLRCWLLLGTWNLSDTLATLLASSWDSSRALDATLLASSWNSPGALDATMLTSSRNLQDALDARLL